MSTPMRERAFRIWLLGSFPLSSSSKSVKRFSANIAKSSSSSKISFNVIPSKIEITTGVSVIKKITLQSELKPQVGLLSVRKNHSAIRTETTTGVSICKKTSLQSELRRDNWSICKKTTLYIQSELKPQLEYL